MLLNVDGFHQEMNNTGKYEMQIQDANPSDEYT